jgi:hypothetical protein
MRRLSISVALGTFLVAAGALAQKGGSPASPNKQAVQPVAPPKGPAIPVIPPKAGTVPNPTIVKEPRNEDAPATVVKSGPAVALAFQTAPTVAVASNVIAPKRAGIKGGRDSRTRPPNLSQSSEPSSQPSVAAYGDDVYVVWTEGNPGSQEILMAMSRDSGASFWGGFNMSGTPTNSHRPRVVANAQGVHIVWIENLPSGPLLYVSTSRDRGETFSPPRAVSPVVLTDPAYGLTVLDADAFASFAGTQNGALVAVANLSTNQTVEIMRGYPVRRPVIAAKGKDIAVAWESNILDDWDMNLAISRDRGLSYRNNLRPNRQGKPLSWWNDYGDEWNASIAISDKGEVLVAWEANRDLYRSVYAYRGTPDQLLAFKREERAVFNGSPGRYPSSTDADFVRPMEPHVVSYGSLFFGAAVLSRTVANGENQIDINAWQSGAGPYSWDEPIGSGRSPRVAAGPDGHLTTWVSGPPGRGDIMAARGAANARARAGFKLCENAGDSIAPEVAVARANYVVVWTDMTPGNAEIFFQALPVR